MAAADAPNQGTIEGRVFNSATGEYVGRARVTVEGTSLETFTNDFGEYRLAGVTAGNVSLKVAYIGRSPITATVEVPPGGKATKDFTFEPTSSDATVHLGKFVVTTDRYKTADEIAINEERNSVNLKNVVSAEAFGHVPDGNVGEFVKYLPGIDTEYGADDAFSGAGLGGANGALATQVSVRGFGAADTAITIDGVPVVGNSPAGLTRAVSMDTLSLNNASRIEVVKVPTPDMVAVAGGGTINLVTKSAWEYSKPQYTVTGFINFNSLEHGSIFKRQPGPANKSTFHTLPGGSFSAVVPLSKSFGFSVNVAAVETYTPNKGVSNSWQNTTVTYSRIPTNNPTPTTTVTNQKGQASDLASPFLRQVSLTDQPFANRNVSTGLRLDWRPFRALTTSLNYNFTTSTATTVYRRFQASASRPLDWGPTFTLGRPYENAAGSVPALDTQNAAALETNSRDKNNFNNTLSLRFTYVYGLWTVDGSASYSEAYTAMVDTKHGHFSDIQMSLLNVGQVILNDIQDGTPHSIKMFDRSGNPLDYTQLNNWTLGSGVTVSPQNTFQRSLNQTYQLNLRRDFPFRWVSFSPKIGGNYRIDNQHKWGLGTGFQMAYVGPTLTPADILDREYIVAPGFGFTVPQQYPDVYRMYDIYQAHPEYFNPNASGSMQAGNYKTRVQQYKVISTTSKSWYAQLETRLLHNRLTIVTGVNGQQGNTVGSQMFTDTKWNYLKLPNGLLYKDSVYPNGIKIDGSSVTNASGVSVRAPYLTDTSLQQRLTAAGVVFPDHMVLDPTGANGTPANSVEGAMRSFYTRTTARSVKPPVRPSIIVAGNVLADLKAQVSWNRSTTLPNLDAGNANNSAGTTALLGTYSINETLPESPLPGGQGTITVANPSLRPKITDSYNYSMSYYTPSGGSLQGTYYYTVTKNNWLTTTYLNTDPAYDGLLEGIGLDPATFANWTISTTDNGDAKSSTSGYEFQARQNLGIIHPFGKHFNVQASFTNRRIKNSTKPGVVGAVSSADQKAWSAGLSFSYNRFSVSARAVYHNTLKTNNGSTITYNGVKYQIVNVTPELIKVDLDLDYQINNRWSIWANGRNVLNTHQARYSYDYFTGIMPGYAHLTSNSEFGIQTSVGVRARF